MADLLDQIRRDIDQRLRELRPAVEEAERLKSALEALGRTGDEALPRTTRSTPRSTRTQITKAEAEARRRQTLAMLAEDPHTKAAALAAMFGTSANNIYSLLRRLEREGTLTKTQDGYRVARQTEAPSGSEVLGR